MRDDRLSGISRSEIRQEISFYLEMRTRELIEQGMEPDEARRVAVEAFGDPDRIEGEVLSMEGRMGWTGKVLELAASVAHDVRYAARFLRGNPAFSLVAVATLALGIGATTAIYSLLDAALLREPAVEDPASLVAVYTTCRRGAPRCSSSYPDYEDYRDRTERIADLAATFPTTFSLGDEQRGSRLVRGAAVTGNFFGLIGVAPALGRPLVPADDANGVGEAVVVLAYDFWQDHFGGDPAIVGQSIRLNGTSFEIVGVAAEAYRGLLLGERADLWLPLGMASRMMFSPSGVREGTPPEVAGDAVWMNRGSRWIARLVGRLAPGATPEQARAELLALSDRMVEEEPMARNTRTVTLDPLGRYLMPLGAEESLPRFVWLLMGVVGATLLLACANLANLLLARASARSAEVGVRMAIGAGRRRLVRQLFVESLMLALLGGFVGLGVAVGLLRVLGSYELPGGMPISALGGSLDARVLAVAFGLSLLTALFCGVLPALRATRPDVVESLKSGRGRVGERGAGRLRKGLVSAQVALCLVLLVGSGLFIRTVRSALGTDLGFDVEALALLYVDLSVHGYGPEEGLVFADEMLERISARPDVVSAAAASNYPIAGGSGRGTFVSVDGYRPVPDEEMRVDMVGVTPGYFETLGMPLLAGRTFTTADASDAEPVAIISRVMADRYWPGGRALGGTFAQLPFGRTDVPTWRVVGVVDDVHWNALEEEPTNYVFVPAEQADFDVFRYVGFSARATRDAEAVLEGFREEIAAIDPDLSVSRASTMGGYVDELIMPQRVGAVLLTAFGALALLLAAVGIAGVVSYSVAARRRAIGLRMALGARRASVLRLVVGEMAVPVVLGVAVGLGVALVANGAVEGFLYGVDSTDPATYAVIAVGLVGIALIAALVPAGEATRIDPMEVLRAE